MTRQKNTKHSPKYSEAVIGEWISELQEGQRAIAEMKPKTDCEGCLAPIAARNRLLCSLICGQKKKSLTARKWVESRKK